MAMLSECSTDGEQMHLVHPVWPSCTQTVHQSLLFQHTEETVGTLVAYQMRNVLAPLVQVMILLPIQFEHQLQLVLLVHAYYPHHLLLVLVLAEWTYFEFASTLLHSFVPYFPEVSLHLLHHLSTLLITNDA